MALQLERMQLGLAKSQSALSPARAALAALGIEAEHFRSLPIPQQLETLAEAFARFADGPAKTAAAMALLGRAGADMIPYLDRGKEGIRDLADEASAAGGVLSAQMVAALAKTREDLSLLGVALGGASSRFLAFINEPLDGAIKGLTQLVAAANPSAIAGGIRELADKSIDEANAVANFAIKAENALSGLGKAIELVAKGFKELQANQPPLDATNLDKTGGLGDLFSSLMKSGDPTGI